MTLKNTLTTVALTAALAGCSSGTNTSHQTPVEMGQTITLPLPEEDGATLHRALSERASVREFDSAPLSLGQLGGVLWASSGVNRAEGGRTAPSALALYPVRVYAFFADGAYLYEAGEHRLERVLTGDFRRICGMQEFVFSAPLNLIYAADLNVFTPRGIPAGKGRELAGLDAAGYAQNVNLYCAAHGLGSITRGSYPEQELLEALGLDDGMHAVVLAQTVGGRQ